MLSPNFAALFRCLKPNSFTTSIWFPKGLFCTIQFAVYWLIYTYSLLSLWVLSLLLSSACSLNFGQLSTPKQWILSFILKALLQMRHLPSSSILDKPKKEEDPIANTVIYLVIFILSFVQSVVSQFIYMLKLFQKVVKLQTNQYVNSRLLFTDPNKFIYHLYIIQLRPGSYN